MSRRYGNWHRYSSTRERLDGSEELRIGKEYEKSVADRLTADMQFNVTDVSMLTYKNANEEDRYYPFDLIAVSPYYSLAIDVKYRRSKAPISIPQYQVIFQSNFSLGIEVDDRIYVFCTPNLPDSYIKMSELLPITESSSMGLYLLGGSYIIERQMTHSLSLIRKIREVAHLL